MEGRSPTLIRYPAGENRENEEIWRATEDRSSRW